MVPNRIKEGLAVGFGKACRSYIWILKILLPISLLTSLLEWSGLIHRLDFLIQPVMGWLHLPASAALPLIIGMLTGIYGGIAAMVALPFTPPQMTLIAIFMMIAHNLIQEGVIQGKSGLSPLKATAFRLGAAVLTVLAVAPFLDLPPTFAQSVAAPPAPLPFAAAIGKWAVSTFYLLLKILAILIGFLVSLELFKALGWIGPLVKWLGPLLRFMGLSRNVGILWLTGSIFGLVYSSALIFEEVREGKLEREELEELHVSIGLHHSVIEDPLLFLALGVGAFWLWVPRFLMTVLIVRLFSRWNRRKRVGC